MKHLPKVAALLIGLTVAMGATGCTSKPEAGEVGVIRNGGPFDNKNIRETVDNGSGLSWIGFYSNAHYYPVDSQQRFFRMADRGQADSGAITVPTSDGVDVAIEGTFYLNTRFNNSPEGIEVLKKFDTQFATRTFGGKHAYEGAEGWENFLAAMVEPVVVNNLRETISKVKCAELVSSCALVQNDGGKKISLKDIKSAAGIVEIQNAVQAGLTKDLDATLRGNYFGNVQFRLSRVLLPTKIQDAINDAQSAFAQVSQAQAKVESAKAEAQANEERQDGYNNCPTCQKIDILKALPEGLQALGGNGFTVGLR